MIDTGTRYRVAIIGAGKIGSGFDSPRSKHVLTHAHAFSAEPRTELAGFFDTDPEKAAIAAKRWGTKAFSSLDALCAARPDIVVIATPDETHAAVLAQVLVGKPRLVICEKPVATNREEADRLARSRVGIPVIINFRRRFDPAVAKTAEAIRAKEYGNVISAHAIYDRGILHNGSHMLDLARNLFGEFQEGTALARLPDLPGGEPSVSGFARFQRCPEFFLSHGDGRRYSIFELDIVLEKKRIRFVDEGFSIETQDVIDDPLFAGFKKLGPPASAQTGLGEAMSTLAAHAVAVLDEAESPRSSLEEALKTHEACLTFAGGAKMA